MFFLFQADTVTFQRSVAKEEHPGDDLSGPALSSIEEIRCLAYFFKVMCMIGGPFVFIFSNKFKRALSINHNFFESKFINQMDLNSQPYIRHFEF